MNKLLIPIAAMVCLLPGCGYSPCDCAEYNKLEEFKANQNNDIDNYSALLQEAQELRIQLDNRKSVLERVPSVKTRIRVMNTENAKASESSEITSGHSYDQITSALASAQNLIEAKCAHRGYVTIEFPVEINKKVAWFKDLDGTLTGDQSDCIHEVLHDMSFDTSEVKLIVRHTFFVRNPKGTEKAKSQPTKLPSPIQVLQALELVQGSVTGHCGQPQPGKVTLNFKIDSSGVPYDITVTKDETNDPEISECIIDNLKHAALPAFPEFDQPPIKYTFHN